MAERITYSNEENEYTVLRAKAKGYGDLITVVGNLAYATTIHKAQGSEYPIVVMPFTTRHFMMLPLNLLYTGLTRAKKVLVLIGTKKAVDTPCGTTKLRNGIPCWLRG